VSYKIKKGSELHLSAARLTDIMTGNMQFLAKVVDKNRITCIFPEMEGMEIPYVRCSL